MKKLAVLAVIAGLAAGIMTGCGGTQRNADAAAQMTGRGNGAQEAAVQSGEVYDDRDDRQDDRNETANTDQAAADQDQAVQQPAATEDEQKEALETYKAFFNTEPQLGTVIVGVTVGLEEARANHASSSSVKAWNLRCSWHPIRASISARVSSALLIATSPSPT